MIAGGNIEQTVAKQRYKMLEIYYLKELISALFAFCTLMSKIACWNIFNFEPSKTCLSELAFLSIFIMILKY